MCAYMYTCTCIIVTLLYTCDSVQACTCYQNGDKTLPPLCLPLQVKHFTTTLDEGGEGSNFEDLCQQLLSKIKLLVETCETPETFNITSGYLTVAFTAIMVLQKVRPSHKQAEKEIIYY